MKKELDLPNKEDLEIVSDLSDVHRDEERLAFKKKPVKKPAKKTVAKKTSIGGPKNIIKKNKKQE